MKQRGSAAHLCVLDSNFLLSKGLKYALTTLSCLKNATIYDIEQSLLAQAKFNKQQE